jgi:hypothetical protein
VDQSIEAQDIKINSAEPPVSTINVAIAAAALSIACLTLSALIGDIGFQGDDWWILSFPYWHDFAESVRLYARESLRPPEGLYWISLFELFGFNSQAFHTASLLLHAAGCALMGACLVKAFPCRQNLALWSMFFAFLLPTVSNLPYMIHTDNSRIALLLFWASALSFQRWGEQKQSWPGLLPGIAWYLLASLTYENATLLIISIPLFVWPICVRENSRLTKSSFFFRLLAGLFAAFVGFVFLRFTVLAGGAVGHSHLIPSIRLVHSYVYTAVSYLLQPFTELSTDTWAWAWGGLVAILAGGLALRAQKADRRPELNEKPSRVESSCYIAAVGAAVTILGLIPYLLAGYTPDLGFHSQSRIYSAGSFGVAILLGLLVTMWKNRRVFVIAQFTAIIAAALMAVFMADLRNGWIRAAENRRQLCSSLLRQVPDVRPETNFLFLDLQWYVDNRAAVFQGVEGLREFIRILYSNKELNAYFLYSDGPEFMSSEGRKATVTPEGVFARGGLGKSPTPLDRLLILRREGNRLHLVDRISADNKSVAMDWLDISAIYSNKSLIGSAPTDLKTRAHICSE